jgi:hypothetical protein
MATNSIKLLTGNSHPALAKLVADRLGIELAKISVTQYSNQETSLTIGESVRDEDGESRRESCRAISWQRGSLKDTCYSKILRMSWIYSSPSCIGVEAL